MSKKLDNPKKQTEKKECEKKVYCNQCSDFINKFLFGGKAYCKQGYNCYEHAKTLMALFPNKEASEGEPEKFPKVVYQLGSDSKEYAELKEKYDKLIEEIQDDLDEVIAWANNYPKDSEIYIRLKRKREKWQGMV